MPTWGAAILTITVILALPTALLLWIARRGARWWERGRVPTVSSAALARRIEAALRTTTEPPRAALSGDLSDGDVRASVVRRAVERGRLAELPYAFRHGMVQILPEGEPAMLTVVDAVSGKPLLALRRMEGEDPELEAWQTG